MQPRIEARPSHERLKNISVSESTIVVSMSVFDCAEQAPPIEVFQLGREFQADTDPNKVSLGVGAYR